MNLTEQRELLEMATAVSGLTTQPGHELELLEQFRRQRQLRRRYDAQLERAERKSRNAEILKGLYAPLPGTPAALALQAAETAKQAGLATRTNPHAAARKRGN